MLGWLRSLFRAPQPSGPAETIRRFAPSDGTLSRDGVAVAQDHWVFEAKENRTVRLFEIPDPEVEQCLLTYRAKLKTDLPEGSTYLEMWCRLPGRGEFFSKGLNQRVSGTTDWVSCEIPFVLKRGQRPDLVKLNLVIEGRGRVRMREIELLRTPLEA